MQSAWSRDGRCFEVHGQLTPALPWSSPGEHDRTWVAAIHSGVEMVNIIREHDELVPVGTVQVFCDVVLTHLRSLRTLKIACKPKHHAMLEMGLRLLATSRTSSSLYV